MVGEGARERLENALGEVFGRCSEGGREGLGMRFGKVGGGARICFCRLGNARRESWEVLGELFGQGAWGRLDKVFGMCPRKAGERSLEGARECLGMCLRKAREGGSLGGAQGGAAKCSGLLGALLGKGWGRRGVFGNAWGLARGSFLGVARERLASAREGLGRFSVRGWGRPLDSARDGLWKVLGQRLGKVFARRSGRFLERARGMLEKACARWSGRLGKC